MRITASVRPYLLTFLATGTTYPISSEEAQQLLDEYPAVSATRNKVILTGHNTTDRVILLPSTLGGGPAFEVAR